MSDDMKQSYDVDTDSLAENLRKLADALDEGGVVLKDASFRKGVSEGHASRFSLELSYLTNRDELTDFVKFKDGERP